MSRSWEIHQHTTAPIATVWSVLVDARRWNEWGRFKVAKLERLGTPADDGVGAIRNFGNPPMVSREEVVVYDEPNHFAYIMLSGMPIKGYRADVHLTPDDAANPMGSGTTIRWCSQFDSARPAFTSGFFAWFLKSFLKDTAKRLARTAEARA
jgi:Polyketide cyclase / dehydrase and lipid transport